MSNTSLLIFVSFSMLFGLAFFATGYFTRFKIGEKKIRTAEIKAEEIQVMAERAAERKRAEMEKEADRYLLRLKQEFDADLIRRKAELESRDRELRDKERELDTYAELTERKDQEIKKQLEEIKVSTEAVQTQKEKLELLVKEKREELRSLSGLGQEEAKRQFLKQLDTDVRLEASRIIKEVEEEALKIADKKAKHILTLAMQKCAAEHSMESTVSVIHLPSEEMKGRIIGKEGRNVRTFEQCTGVDVVIDDAPGTVVLSGFDPVRREIARLAMTQLIEDGRIHPSVIEETVGKVKKHIHETIQSEGERAVFDLGIIGMNPELIYLVGSLKFRSSYGQNSLDHCKEVAALMSTIASEMKIDADTAKRAGLLHDIGKAVNNEVEGPHAIIGADLARKHGEAEDVVHAIEAHHDDVSPKSIWPILVQTADTISAARPGARRENLEHYVQRLQKLERVAASIPGVEQVFAIQAGREIRILVNPDRVPDSHMPAIAREITKTVEENLNFPGQIRVTVIRETRAVDFAKSLTPDPKI
ncbi:MAG: ribonuclease Y [Candidatus Omnitrophica bacterium]|nr:ribonuclease Y [Candidatus Omnitrophota bacterium]